MKISLEGPPYKETMLIKRIFLSINLFVCFFSDHSDVVGSNCEDEGKIRLDYIDEGIRAIKPPVDNKDLQVEFVPVVENDQMIKEI